MEKNNEQIHLRDMGSFHIGGRRIQITDREVKEVIMTHGGEPVKFDMNQIYQGEQMYVQYFIPTKVSGKHPLLLWHGGGLTGSTFESTPDGRPGWLNFFIKQGWQVYLSDAVERGRSGWLPYHEIFKDEPLLFPEYFPYEVWRIGKKGDKQGSYIPFEGTQFPIESYENLIKKLVPSWVSSYEATLNAYKELVQRNESNVIIAHSQGAAYAFKVAEQCPEKVKGIVALEPGIGGDLQNAYKLKDIPILAIYGDYIQQNERWTTILDRTKEYYNEIQQAGGNVDLVYLRDKGFKGNSHMMMMDKNSDEIAQFIQSWMRENGFEL